MYKVWSTSVGHLLALTLQRRFQLIHSIQKLSTAVFPAMHGLALLGGFVLSIIVLNMWTISWTGLERGSRIIMAQLNAAIWRISIPIIHRI